VPLLSLDFSFVTKTFCTRSLLLARRYEARVIEDFLFEMKAVLERWETLVARLADEYPRIVDEFAVRGRQLGLERAIVVGSHNRSENGSDRLFRFDILFIESAALPWKTYVSKSRFRDLGDGSHMKLCQQVLVFEDAEVERYEKSMLRALTEFDDVVFVEEFSPLEGRVYLYRRRLIHSRVIPDELLVTENDAVARFCDSQFHR
jgi:hypothetical protein